MDWDSHVEKLLHKDCFEHKYCMDLCTHSNLVTILDPYLERKESKSNGSDPVQVEHIMGLGLCVLAGGTLSDNRHIFGVSVTESYQSFDSFIDAVNLTPKL